MTNLLITFLMNVLVLCPMDNEYDNFNAALSARGELKNHYKVVTCGVGKVEAAAATALEVYDHPNSIDLVAVVGYAAGSSAFKQGEFVMPSSCRYHDARVPEGFVPALEKEYPLIGLNECVCLTGDSFVDKELADELTAKYGNDVLFDMECCAVSQVCDDINIPCIVLKLISDIPQNDSNLQSFVEFTKTHTDFSAMVDYLEMLANSVV